MDGVFNINKPRGISSGKVVSRVRKWTGVRKSGHAGTLDPAAEGVLLVCQGRATKLVERCMDLPKTYKACARLDLTSPAFDGEKGTTPVQVERVPEREEIQILFAERFTGLVEQVPPAFSAVKIKGRPAYKLAVKGQPVELKARPVMVYRTEINRYEYPFLDLTVTCGRGTYIRALIRDVGLALGTGGCLMSLARSAIGPFTLENAIPLDELDRHDPQDVILRISQFDSRLSAYFDENSLKAR